MAYMKRLAEPLGILLVFTSMAFNMERTTDFVPVLKTDDIIIVKDPPNITSNKTTTDPTGGGK